MKISVAIDSSGSMRIMGKWAIVQSVCRDLVLQKKFEFEFYLWNEGVKSILFGDGLNLNAEGKANIDSLCDFIKKNYENEFNLVLLTDGFADGEVEKISVLVRDTEKLKFRIVGIGADFDFNRARNFFPKNLTATEKFVFSPSDIFALLESFYLEK